EDSKLPYLLRLPLEGGLVLKTRELWPATARVYCHRFEEAWPEEAEIVEQTPVLLCRRRGAAIDLVLDRPRRARSNIPCAWARRNSPHDGPPRRGAGPKPERLRTDLIVVAPTRMPSVRSSPWIRTHP